MGEGLLRNRPFNVLAYGSIYSANAQKSLGYLKYSRCIICCGLVIGSAPRHGELYLRVSFVRPSTSRVNPDSAAFVADQHFCLHSSSRARFHHSTGPLPPLTPEYFAVHRFKVRGYLRDNEIRLIVDKVGIEHHETPIIGIQPIVTIDHLHNRVVCESCDTQRCCKCMVKSKLK